MTTKPSPRHRVKVSVTVDPLLLRALDDFVARHPGVDRSKVFDEALYLWYARQQEAEIAAQHRAPQSADEQEERQEWRRIQAAASERLFRRRRED